jgi:hypothetical protein
VSGTPPPPDDENLNQASLRWAKKYATYLVEYERALAGGAKGFTVFFQRRFNDLLSQNQFNAEGMSGLLDDQIREAARLAAGKTVYATPENLKKIAERNNEMAMGFGVQTTATAAAPAQSVADVRSKAQESILKIKNRTDLTDEQKSELSGKVRSLYKQKTGMDF